MRQDRIINVFYHDRLVGTLAMTNERKAAFEYADEWLEKMENMEKAGIDFVNISKIDIHMKKKMPAIIGGAVMIVFMIFLIGMFLWGNSVDPIPLGLLIVLVAIPVVIIVCIIGVLIGRIREIDGGEEDEAAKY